jgi:hypothetical protein
VVFFDERVTPHGLQQLILFHDLRRRGNQDEERIECLGRERDEPIASPEAALRRIDSEGAKPIARWLSFQGVFRAL